MCNLGMGIGTEYPISDDSDPINSDFVFFLNMNWNIYKIPTFDPFLISENNSENF